MSSRPLTAPTRGRPRPSRPTAGPWPSPTAVTSVQLWDLDADRPSAPWPTPPPRPSSVRGLGFSEDGRTLASTSCATGRSRIRRPACARPRGPLIDFVGPSAPCIRRGVARGRDDDRPLGVTPGLSRCRDRRVLALMESSAVGLVLPILVRQLRGPHAPASPDAVVPPEPLRPQGDLSPASVRAELPHRPEHPRPDRQDGRGRAGGRGPGGRAGGGGAHVADGGRRARPSWPSRSTRRWPA